MAPGHICFQLTFVSGNTLNMQANKKDIANSEKEKLITCNRYTAIIENCRLIHPLNMVSNEVIMSEIASKKTYTHDQSK